MHFYLVGMNVSQVMLCLQTPSIKLVFVAFPNVAWENLQWKFWQIRLNLKKKEENYVLYQ